MPERLVFRKSCPPHVIANLRDLLERSRDVDAPARNSAHHIVVNYGRGGLPCLPCGSRALSDGARIHRNQPRGGEKGIDGIDVLSPS